MQPLEKLFCSDIVTFIENVNFNMSNTKTLGGVECARTSCVQ